MITMSLSRTFCEEELATLNAYYGDLNQDALWKWAFILALYQTENKTGDIVIEAGGGHSPVSPLLARVANVTNVDINFGDQWFPPRDIYLGERKPTYVQQDFISYCKGLPDNSVDTVIDGCSIIHFNTSPENINKGLYEACVEIRRILKPGGLFIIAADALYPDFKRDLPSNSGELLYPERLHECILNSGLKSRYGINIECEPDAILLEERPGPQHTKLAFPFPIQGWISNGKRMTVCGGVYHK